MALRKDHQRIQERLQNSYEMRNQNKDESRTIAALRKANEDLTGRLQKEKNMRQEKNVDLENCQQEVCHFYFDCKRYVFVTAHILSRYILYSFVAFKTKWLAPLAIGIT